MRDSTAGEPTGDPPRFVTVEMMAEAFGVATRTITSWEEAGKLPKALRNPDGEGWRRWPVATAIEALRGAGYPVPERWEATS